MRPSSRWRLLPLLLLLVAAACSGRGPTRTAVLFGLRLTTSMPQALAVIADAIDADGTPRHSCYAQLGPVGGEQTVGSPMPAGTRVHLRLGAAADIWHVDAAGNASEVASRTLRGLCGATPGSGTLELRNADATTELDADAGATLTIDSLVGLHR